MVKNRFLFVAMLFAALSLGFVSCDDKKGNEPDDPTQGEQTEQNGSTGNNDGGDETPEPETPAIDYNGHAYVDLGLSVKWATCNVGATKSEDYGNLFAWGEVEPKETYNWTTYFDTNDGGSTFLKYYGEKTTLEAEDDAAAVNMGGDWRMPTREELHELWDINGKCTTVWTADYNGTGIAGRIVTSNINGNHIFLPAGINNKGSIWSSSLDIYKSDRAFYITFSENDLQVAKTFRDYGRSVRGVIE